MSEKKPTPNDQRSNVKNPNNPAHKSDQDNRANQLNPNNPAHWSSRGQTPPPTPPPATPGSKR